MSDAAFLCWKLNVVYLFIAGCAIYACVTRQELMKTASQVTNDDVNPSIMADVQQKHSIELHSVIKAIQSRVRRVVLFKHVCT